MGVLRTLGGHSRQTSEPYPVETFWTAPVVNPVASASIFSSHSILRLAETHAQHENSSDVLKKQKYAARRGTLCSQSEGRSCKSKLRCRPKCLERTTRSVGYFWFGTPKTVDSEKLNPSSRNPQSRVWVTEIHLFAGRTSRKSLVQDRSECLGESVPCGRRAAPRNFRQEQEKTTVPRATIIECFAGKQGTRTQKLGSFA